METEKKDIKNTKPDDQIGLSMSSHLVIKDKTTGQELVRKRG